MRSVLCFVSVLMLFTLTGNGSDINGKVHISGMAPGHAGEEIVFYCRTDYISFTEKEIFRFRVDDNDEFSAGFYISDPTLYIFSPLGIYFVYMYVEPGRDYQVVLPGRSEISERERLNPYFEGIPTHIAVLGQGNDCLNSLISRFDSIYEPLFGEPLIRLSFDRDRRLLDSIHHVFETEFADADHPYFVAYKSYKLAFLGLVSQFQSARTISDNFFRDKPVLYNNMAYMELFNQVYNKYFMFFSRTPRGSRIFDDINRYRSLTLLNNTIDTDTVLGAAGLREMVIMKGLHDAFYGSDFSRTGLLTVLDSLAAVTDYDEHALIAGRIRAKVTRLMIGFEPPVFELLNREGKMTGLSDFRGHYVYLNFCTAASYSCLTEYEVLSSLHEKHGENLKIVTVYIDDSHSSMREFLGKNNYGWDFLFYGNQPSVLKEYDIRIFPSYYFIGRDGKLLMSPAPSPAEDFESYLLKIIEQGHQVR